jgi:release factor glutamine methyltransferase
VSEEPASPAPAPANEWTVRKVLEWTTGHLKKHGSDTPRLDAEILLAFARGCQRIQLYTAYDETLTDAIRGKMRELVQRRAQAEPVAYLVGHREFFSLDFRVTKDVLIPRPDTETLVIEIIEAVKQLATARQESGDASPVRVIDLCTGSGCVAVSVAKRSQMAKLNVQITATDISPAALAIAAENAAKHGVQDLITFVEGDLFAPVATESRFDIIASNPPYIPTAEIATLDAEVAKHEPLLALDGGASGFDVIDRLIAATPDYATTNALFLMELSPEQADTANQKLIAAGKYIDVTVRKDLAARPRVMKARLP